MELSRNLREGIAVANKGLSMRRVREVLRLHHVAGLSARAIARSLKISPVTVRRYVWQSVRKCASRTHGRTREGPTERRTGDHALRTPLANSRIHAPHGRSEPRAPTAPAIPGLNCAGDFGGGSVCVAKKGKPPGHE